MRRVLSLLLAGWLMAAGVTALPLEPQTGDAAPERASASWSQPGAAGVPTVERERIPRPTPDLQALPIGPRRDLVSAGPLGRPRPSEVDPAGSTCTLTQPQRGPPTSG